MSYPQEHDRRSGRDRRATMDSTTIGWFSEEVRMTRGFLLAVVAVVFAFVGFGTWGAVATVNSLRDEDCRQANERRADVREIAHDLVDNDRFLIGLADSLTTEGLPAEFTDPLAARYDDQDVKIDTAYAAEPCP